MSRKATDRTDPFAPAAAPGSSYALVLQFLPHDARPAVAFLFSLKLTLDALLTPEGEADVMRVKALWWEDELRGSARDRARHPLTVRARSLGLFPRPGMDALADVAADYAALVGRRPASAEETVERARLTGGEFAARVARALGETAPEGLEAARRIGTAHETVALLLHDRATRARFPSGGHEQRALLGFALDEITRARASLGARWRSPGQRASRVLAAITLSRRSGKECRPLRRLFVAWWSARQEEP